MASKVPSALALPDSIISLIPADDVSISVLQHTFASLPTPIFNHSLRVYLLARHLHEVETSSGTLFTHPSTVTSTSISPSQSKVIAPPTIFATAMFHDFGTHPSHNGPQRFEVEGADAAVAFLRSCLSPDALDAIWAAIALHTSVGIAERIDPFTRLLRVAVKSDFSPTVCKSLGLSDYATEIEHHLPRLGIEECLARTVVGQATRGELQQGLYATDEGEQDGVWTDSAKFPCASWPGVLLRGHLERVRDRGEGWKGPNPAF